MASPACADTHQHLVAETLGQPDGVALIDESGVVKQGADSVGVAHQYCGSVGKVANSQVGVYLGYVSRKGYIKEERNRRLSEASVLNSRISQQESQTAFVPLTGR